MGKPLRVLIVEDSDDDYELLLRELRRGGFEPDAGRAETDEAMRQALEAQTWDIILADYVLPRFSGTAALQALRESGRDIPLIIVSGTIGEETAVQAMRMGAHDYIMKDRLSRLPAAIERELAEAQVRRERRRAENALRESEERYRMLFELESDAIVIIDNATGRLLAANHAASEMYGYTREELLALKNTDLSAEPEKTRRATAENLTDLEKTIYAPLRYHRNKDGETFPAEITGRFFTWQGQSVHIAAIRNIAERVRAEQLLRALNRAALAMAQAMTRQDVFAAAAYELGQVSLNCAILTTDPEQRYLWPTFVSYSEGTLQAIGDLIGVRPGEYAIPIEQVDFCRQVILERQTVLIHDVGEVVRQVLPASMSVHAGRVNQQLRASRFIAAPLTIQDRVIGLLSVQSSSLQPGDVPTITAFANQVAAAWHKADLMNELQNNLRELQQTQNQLIQAQKMEAIGRLAGGVAHDFNNHLTAIMGYAEMLQAELDPHDPRYKDAAEIRTAAERSTALTRQLLAFSRKQIIRPRVLNLNDLVGNMNGMLHRLIGEDVDLQTRLAADLGSVQADPGQIEQVIMNLSINARDAMPQGGRLIIQTANVDIDDTYARQHVQVQPGSYVKLCIADTGIGMDQETMSHLFEPFFTTKKAGKGTGLGLATVYGIVKQSNGYVFAYSEPGMGATFKIYLPRIDQAVEAVETDELSGDQPLGNETILVVEDDESVRSLARRILAQSGYNVLQARNPDEALELCARHTTTIHLLLSDVVMPGHTNSQEMVARIVASRPGIKVLYMSGYTDDAIAHRGVLSPGVHLINKPFTRHTLTCVVRQMLDENQTEAAYKIETRLNPGSR
ncbi:MAG: response regulator [Anaerolineae bacterium]|nr:response regulator [Anaerolineae bacterium]